MHSTTLEPAPTSAARVLALHHAVEQRAAEAAWRARLAQAPDDALALGNLGGLLNQDCRFDEAEPMLLRAVALDPSCWTAWSNLGNTMVERQRYDDAVAAYSNALRCNPAHGPTLSNLGVALTARGLPGPALTFLDLAAACEPDNAETRCNRALALLAKGDWTEGFAEYEWRWRTRAKPPHPYRVPLWAGEEFEGRTLLLHDEGGFGDTLQFVRYAALAKARGGTVLLRVREPLVTLLSRLPGLDRVIAHDAELPGFDLHCPMFTLPRVFGTTPDTVPEAAGYLRPDPARMATWRDRLDRDLLDRDWPPGPDRPRRIGLVWAGGPHPYARESALADRRRSIRLDDLAPLADAAPDALFYSLQKGDASAEALSPPPGLRLVDHTGSIDSFDDTAALVSQLDLVIAVDTSTAHLAAGLGRPVWMLSRYDQCWRWLTGRTDTPWYRTMRVYQQPAPFDWTSPIARVCAELR